MEKGKIVVFKNLLLCNNVAKMQEYHGPETWQKHEQFCVDLLNFEETLIHLFYFNIKKYVIRNIVPSLLKHSLIYAGEDALGWCNAKELLMRMDQSAPRDENHITMRHLQEWFYNLQHIYNIPIADLRSWLERRVYHIRK